eukprot:gene350-983_t
MSAKRPTSNLPVEKLELGFSASFIAFRRFTPSVAAKPVGVIFCQGLMSNMDGLKAQFLEKYCRNRALNYVCFDYMGHGHSSGKFEDFTIGLWKRNTVDVLQKLTQGPQVIVGSSIGAWIMLLAALDNPSRIHGLVGIASAPDFLFQRYASLNNVDKSQVNGQGYYSLPSEYSDQPYRIAIDTMHEAENHLVFGGPQIEIDCAVRLIHGMNDKTVPYKLSVKLAERLKSNNIRVHLVKDGDHRMSKDEDLGLIANNLDEVIFNDSSFAHHNKHML